MFDSIESQAMTSLDQQIQKLKELLDKKPDDLSILMVFAEANLQKGNRLEAMKAYQKVVKIKPDVVDVRVALVKIYYSLGHFRDGYQELAEIFRLSPRNIDAHLLLKQMSRVSPVPRDFLEELNPHLSFRGAPSKIKKLQMESELETNQFKKLLEQYDTQLEEDEGNPIIMFNRKKALDRLEQARQTLSDLEEMMGDREDEEIFPGIAQLPEGMEMIKPIAPVEKEIPPAEPEPLLTGEEDTPPVTPVSMLSMAGFADIAQEPLDEVPEEIQGIPLDEMDELEDIETSPVEEMDDILKTMSPAPETSILVEDFSLDEEPVAIEPEPEPEPPRLISQERESFYKSVEADLNELLNVINKTRGVTSSVVIDDKGFILASSVSESFDLEDVKSQVLAGLEPLVKWFPNGGEARKLLYWVLEFGVGLMVLQPLIPEIYLVVFGKTGANFGSLKFSIDKNNQKFTEILSNIPQ